jgi:hypothetical protein
MRGFRLISKGSGIESIFNRRQSRDTRRSPATHLQAVRLIGLDKRVGVDSDERKLLYYLAPSLP